MELQQRFIDMALKSWYGQVSRTTKAFDAFTDEGLQQEVAPGRNTVIYLLGHLTAVNDALMPLLGLGERQFTHYDEAFLRSADKSGHVFPDAATLRADWKKSVDTLHAAFETLDAAGWMDRHTAVSEEDFAKEPGRNKLNVLLSRTTHLAYHLGQLVLVAQK